LHQILPILSRQKTPLLFTGSLLELLSIDPFYSVIPNEVRNLY
jgi:hypothetical protein